MIKNQQVVELKEQQHKDLIAEKALQIFQQGKVSKVAPNKWKVLGSDGKHEYDCSFDEFSILNCTCPYFQFKAAKAELGEVYCKHLLALAHYVSINGV